MADSRKLLLSLIDRLLDDVRLAAAETKSLGLVVAHICHLDNGDAQSAAVYLKERGFSGHAVRLTRDVDGLLQKVDEPIPDDQKQEKRYLRELRSEVHRLFRFLDELRSLVDEDDDAVTTECEPAAGGEATPPEANKVNGDTPTVTPAGLSDSSTAKAARLREIAAKVRQVAGACNEGYWKGCIALGPLFKEAYGAGAWHREGSQIGDRLKRVRTDSQELWTDGQSPAWTLEAYFAVVETLTSHLMPPIGEKEQLELEAGIAADEIEEEAKRIEAEAEDETPAVKALKRDVANLKRATKKKTKTEKIREQRNKFSRSHRPHKTWDEIYEAYRKKYPGDGKASPATLRLSFERNPTDNRQ